MALSSKLSSISSSELLDAVTDLSSIREMKVAFSVTAKCGLISLLSTTAGGLAGGPAGIAVGGLLGTLCASYYANNKFKSIPEILRDDATPEQREKLAIALKNLMSAENVFTIAQFIAMLTSDRMLMESVTLLVKEFLTSDMGLSIL